MTQTSNRIFDEMARLMSDAASVATGVKREAETAFKSQIERFVADMDLVKREDFDVVREMASKARAENEALKKRVAALENKLGGASGEPTAAVKPKRTSAPRTKPAKSSPA
jgi:BMFP domain-containing protein YqiC